MKLASIAAGLLLVLAGCAQPAHTTPPAAPAARAHATPSPSRTCLSGRNHFAGDADSTPPMVCVDVGATVDLNALAVGGYQVGAGRWTTVSSSDDAVLTCSLAGTLATCKAVAPGHAIATASGAAGDWRVQVFVGKPAG
jgi:hypothetical protein